MATKISAPTGSVFVRAYDQGVYNMLGAVVSTDPQPLVGRDRIGYWITDVFTAPVKVPVVFNNPEQIYEMKLYPSYLIRRNEINPALARWHSVKSFEYVAGVSGFEEINGVSGYAAVEKKPQAWPYDIFYSISCYARYEHEAIPMMKRILKTFPPYSKIFITDSLGDSRSYSVFNEGGVQDIGDFVDVADRLKAYNIDIRIEGELDTVDPTIFPSTMAGINTTLAKKSKI